MNSINGKIMQLKYLSYIYASLQISFPLREHIPKISQIWEEYERIVTDVYDVSFVLQKAKSTSRKNFIQSLFKTTLNHKQFEKRDRIKKIEYISNSRNKIRKYRIAPRSKLRKIKTDVRNFESTHELCPYVQNPCKSNTIAKPIEINSMQLVKNNSIEKLFGAVVSPEANKSCRPRSEITTEVVGMAQFCALG